MNWLASATGRHVPAACAILNKEIIYVYKMNKHLRKSTQVYTQSINLISQCDRISNYSTSPKICFDPCNPCRPHIVLSFISIS